MLALLVSLPMAAGAAETCTYEGTTSYNGRASIRTIASVANGETTVDVATRLDAVSMAILDLTYWEQEISTWREGELRSAAVNHRYRFAGSIRRQNWDVFRREGGALLGWRIQGKDMSDLRKSHPGFAPHWDTGSYGQPWLTDFSAANPERRADLDLPAPPRIGTPLAMAFYWIRWTPPEGRAQTLILPGFKRDKQAEAKVTAEATDGALHVHSTASHPALSEPATGDAWISPAHRLERVSFDVATSQGAAHGELRLTGCAGVP